MPKKFVGCLRRLKNISEGKAISYTARDTLCKVSLHSEMISFFKMRTVHKFLAKCVFGFLQGPGKTESFFSCCHKDALNKGNVPFTGETFGVVPLII